MRDILGSFVTALDAEIAVIEKESREGSYELLSGRRDDKATGSLYVFVLADTLRLPEDASGTLRMGAVDARASVVALEGNRIWLNVESVDELSAFIPSARLIINETELLVRLKEKIQALDTDDLGLAPKAFGGEPSIVASQDMPLPFERKIQGEGTRRALRQCLGSEVTFLWGPPGTRKTYSIAALVAILATSGETTLVTSHTHAAVEQALYALIEPATSGRQAGLLADAALVEEGRVLKVGPLRSSKIPRSVHLDSYLEDRASERERNAEVLVDEQTRIDEELREIDRDLVPWVTLREAQDAQRAAMRRLDEAIGVHEVNTSAVAKQRLALETAEAALTRARTSFLIGRGGRVERAAGAVSTATRILTHRQATAGESNARIVERRLEAEASVVQTSSARLATSGEDEPTDLGSRRSILVEHRETLAEQVRALRESEGEDPNELLTNARSIFATLTKLYTDRNKLSELRWDNVIIDEASMAMLPLVAFAA